MDAHMLRYHCLSPSQVGALAEGQAAGWCSSCRAASPSIRIMQGEGNAWDIGDLNHQDQALPTITL